MNDLLSKYCQSWQLSEPRLLTSTFTSDVYLVCFNGSQAVLKILNEKGKQFEVRGAAVLKCFNGNGAVRIFQADEGAHLLEYVDGPPLRSIVEEGDDTFATEIVCQVIEKLHSYDGPIPNELISMERNFRALFLRAKQEPLDSLYVKAARLAEKLLATEQETKVLHGDIHHENILKSSRRGWLAIDPQCLFGERTYEVANTFYNPNGFLEFASSPETILRRCEIFASKLNLDEKRILQFAFTYGCLSAAWCIEDGQSPDGSLRIAKSVFELVTKN